MSLFLVGLSLTLTQLFKESTQHSPSTIFFTGVVLSAAYGGIGPSLMNALVSTLAYNYYFSVPTHHLFSDPYTFWRSLLFAACALIVSAVYGARKQVEERLRANELALEKSKEDLARLNLMLEQKVMERTGELRKKEEELYQSRKLEAMGRLAGGVAHDFNNLLTGILGITEDLQQTFTPPHALHTELGEIVQACQRAFALTKQLLTFGRRQAIEPKIIDLNSTIQGLSQLLKRLIREDISLEFDLREGLQIKADPTQLSQVIMNLVINARDAMPRGGVLTIRATDREEMGPRAVLEVIDTGTGMDEETLSHIFEPFFTTKGDIRGTGLGLATVYGIVQQSGGRISVQSKLGIGTTFRLSFPAITADQPSDLVESIPIAKQHAGSRATILLIDDEALVRRAMNKKLLRAGYQVVDSKNGAEALALARQFPSKIDLVITDVVMPGMNGLEFTSEFSKLHPNVPVLYMSGYPREVVGSHGILGQGKEFVDKSNLLQEILPRVESLLAKAAAEAK